MDIVESVILSIMQLLIAYYHRLIRLYHYHNHYCNFIKISLVNELLNLERMLRSMMKNCEL